MSCFAQSRAVAKMNWELFVRRYGKNFVVKYDATSLPISIEILESTFRSMDDSQLETLLYKCVFELNTYRTHLSLWEAAETNPLNTILSAAWTLCVSSLPPNDLLKSTDDKTKTLNEKETSIVDDRNDRMTYECYSIWWSMSLLCCYLVKLKERSNRSPSTSDDVELQSLFTAEQLIEKYRLYVESFERFKKFSNKDDMLRAYHELEDQYFVDPKMRARCRDTPFGMSIRENRRTIRYVEDLNYVDDKRRLSNQFRLNEIFDDLRTQAEQRLRAYFQDENRDAALDPVRIDDWTLPMLVDDETSPLFTDLTDEERSTGKSRKTHYMFWQYQKSSLVWFLVHTLFALNDSLKLDQLNFDLLRFASEHLIRLVECKVCSTHWQSSGQELWRLYEKRFAFTCAEWDDKRRRASNDNKQLGRLYNSLTCYAVNAATDFSVSPPDLFMLQTHNRIQGTNVDSEKLLSEACLKSLQLDFKVYAALIETQVVRSQDARFLPASARLRDAKTMMREIRKRDTLTKETDVYVSEALNSAVRAAARSASNKNYSQSGGTRESSIGETEEDDGMLPTNFNVREFRDAELKLQKIKLMGLLYGDNAIQ